MELFSKNSSWLLAAIIAKKLHNRSFTESNSENYSLFNALQYSTATTAEDRKAEKWKGLLTGNGLKLQ